MGCERLILTLELQEEMRIVRNNISAEGRREGGQSAGGHTCERANASALGQSQGEIIISETVHSREDIAAGPVVRATFELMLPRHMPPTLETPALSLRWVLRFRFLLAAADAGQHSSYKKPPPLSALGGRKAMRTPQQESPEAAPCQLDWILPLSVLPANKPASRPPPFVQPPSRTGILFDPSYST
jgi:hypothetical protein